MSIAAGLWKTRRRRHYLCITAHSMNDDFVLISKVHSFKKLNGHHCAKLIGAHMEQIITEFGLRGKII